ncbi:MAG: zf-TFIIB domain-containing protein [Kofleriaceae bacterium]
MILACTGCDSRYDVSGYPAGQQFRCRCGTVTSLARARAEAGLLACPRCGAGVSPADAQCAYCRAELLLKACPRCLSRVFHGHKHCPECGTTIDHAAHGDARPDAPCPRCDQPLHGRLVDDIVIDECRQCAGVFLDRLAIERVVTDRRQARADTLLGALTRAETSPLPAGGRMYVKCPTCAKVMNRKQFAVGARVVVDVCREHGTFFDAGELPRIIEFVMGGGLEAAERVELQRLRDEVKRERQNVQYAAIVDSRVSSRAREGASSGRSAAIVADLLLSLFR